MKTDSEQLTASALAPEEIARGQYVAALYRVVEFLPLEFYFGAEPHRQPQTVRVALPPCAPTELYRVVDVCLPFVLVKKPDGTRSTIDVRHTRLARISNAFGRRVFKRKGAATSSEDST